MINYVRLIFWSSHASKHQRKKVHIRTSERGGDEEGGGDEEETEGGGGESGEMECLTYRATAGLGFRAHLRFEILNLLFVFLNFHDYSNIQTL